MKKLKSISLIETLISLAIVGLSITALLPVMTVKKEAYDPGKGNAYWECKDTDGNPIECANGNARVLRAKDNLPVSIGGTLDKNNIPPLLVDATGFRNNGIAALKVQNTMHYAGQMITADDSDHSIHIYSDATAGLYNGCSEENAAKTNLYVGDKGVIIESNSSVHDTINVCLEENSPGICAREENRDTQFSFCKNNSLVFYNNNQIEAGGAVYAVQRDNSDLTIQENEYINVSHLPLVSGANPKPERRYIGIGRNALKPFSKEKSATIVAIADNTDIAGANTEFNGLIIGNITAAGSTFNYTNGYVISRAEGDNQDFNINANLKVGQGGTGTIRANAFVVGSDRNLKDILGKYTKGIDEILQLKPVNFTYKSDEKQTPHVGVIAQDLKKVFPESVSSNNENGYLMVNTDGVFYALLNSIKTLNKKNEELEKQNKELEDKIAQLRIIRDRLRAEKGGHDE